MAKEQTGKQCLHQVCSSVFSLNMYCDFHHWAFFFLKKQTFSTFVIVPHRQNAKYVWNKADFDAINPATTDFLMGKNSEVHHLQLRHAEKKNTRPWVL